MMFLSSIDYGSAPNWNMALERNRIKSMTNKPLLSEPIKSDTIQCNFCKEFVEDYYYYCKVHKKIYCSNCARNNNQNVVKFKEAARCTPLAFGDDCILEINYINEK